MAINVGLGDAGTYDDPFESDSFGSGRSCRRSGGGYAVVSHQWRTMWFHVDEYDPVPDKVVSFARNVVSTAPIVSPNVIEKSR